MYSLSSAVVGEHVVTISASDALSGQSDMLTLSYFVKDLSDTTAPVVSLSSPAQSDEITAPVNVTGAVSDDNLTRWLLFYRRSGAPATEFTVLAEGAAIVADSVLAEFDPSMLRNGQYQIVLQAEDAMTSIRQELTAVTTQLNLVQSYYDRQLAQITDLYDAQAQLAAVQSEELILQSELELARDALRSLHGGFARAELEIGDRRLRLQRLLGKQRSDAEEVGDGVANHELAIGALRPGVRTRPKFSQRVVHSTGSSAASAAHAASTSVDRSPITASLSAPARSRNA